MSGVHVDLFLTRKWQLWPLIDKLYPGFRVHLPFLDVTVQWDGSP